MNFMHVEECKYNDNKSTNIQKETRWTIMTANTSFLRRSGDDDQPGGDRWQEAGGRRQETGVYVYWPAVCAGTGVRAADY